MTDDRTPRKPSQRAAASDRAQRKSVRSRSFSTRLRANEAVPERKQDASGPPAVMRGFSATDAPPPQPTPQDMRRAFAEIAKRGRLGDAQEHARDLRIDLSDQSRRPAGRLAPRRGRTIERSALGAFAALGIAAAAMLASDADPSFVGVFQASDPHVAHVTSTGGFATGSTSAPKPRPIGPAPNSDPVYVGHEALRALLEAAPVKCVPAGAGSQSSALGLGLRLLLPRPPVRKNASICVESVYYDLPHGVFIRKTDLPGGGVLEVNGAFSLVEGSICHRAYGMTAHVLGSSFDKKRARTIERGTDKAIERLHGRAICHRYRPAAPGTGAGGGAFTADIFLTHGKKPVERGTTPFMLLSERQ